MSSLYTGVENFEAGEFFTKCRLCVNHYLQLVLENHHSLMVNAYNYLSGEYTFSILNLKKIKF